jgi:hypothetical protein
LGAPDSALIPIYASARPGKVFLPAFIAIGLFEIAWQRVIR